MDGENEQDFGKQTELTLRLLGATVPTLFPRCLDLRSKVHKTWMRIEIITKDVQCIHVDTYSNFNWKTNRIFNDEAEALQYIKGRIECLNL